MLSRLFAQEIRENGRQVATIIGVCLLVGAVSFGFAMLDLPVFSALAQSVVVLACITCPLLLFIALGASYWTTMYGARGYFTHSIPARGRDHFWAKTLFAYCSGLIGYLVAGAGILANLAVLAHQRGTSFRAVLDEALSGLDGAPSWIVALVVVGLLVSVANVVFGAAAVMSIGAEGRWNSHGFAVPALGLVLLYVAAQIASLVGILFIPGAIDFTTRRFVWATMLPDFVDAVRTNADIDILGLGMLPATLLLTAGVVWWGISSIEKRTSLR